MPSIVDICNLALLHIGAGASIASLSEHSTEAQTCARIFDIARDSVLRDHDWNFATKNITLAQIETDSDEWKYRFTYPNDCLKARRIVAGQNRTHSHKFKVASDQKTQSRTILCDVNPAILEYTVRAQSPESYDPLFVEALSLRIASLIAFSLTGKTRLRSDALSLYKEAVANARLADAQEGQAEDPIDPEWLTARV